MKVKFVKKDGKEFTQDLSYEQLLLKVISIINDSEARIYSLSSFLADSMLFSVGHTNYQRVNYSDGSFEYREL